MSFSRCPKDEAHCACDCVLVVGGHFIVGRFAPATQSARSEPGRAAGVRAAASAQGVGAAGEINWNSDATLLEAARSNACAADHRDLLEA